VLLSDIATVTHTQALAENQVGISRTANHTHNHSGGLFLTNDAGRTVLASGSKGKQHSHLQLLAHASSSMQGLSLRELLKRMSDRRRIPKPKPTPFHHPPEQPRTHIAAYPCSRGLKIPCFLHQKPTPALRSACSRSAPRDLRKWLDQCNAQKKEATRRAVALSAQIQRPCCRTRRSQSEAIATFRRGRRPQPLRWTPNATLSCRSP